MRMCKNCMWVYHMVAHNPTAPCENCKDYDKWQTMKQTNADRIRSMTDEELAVWMDAVSKAWYDEGYTKETDEPLMSPYPSTASTWATWLKQEAKDEKG